MWKFRLVLLAVFFLLGCAKKPEQKKIEGPTLPEAVFTKSDGQKIRTAELDTGIVVIGIVTSWCVPCRQDIIWLDGAKKLGANVLALTYEEPSAVARIIESLKVDVPVAYADTSFFLELGLKAYPMRILLKDGIILHSEIGALPPQQSQIQRKLEEFFIRKDTLAK